MSAAEEQSNERVSQKPTCRCNGKGFYLKKVRALKVDGTPMDWPDGTPMMVDASAECECAKEKRARRLMDISEITPEFKKKTFASFVTEGKEPIIAEMKQIALNYYTNFPDIKSDRRNSIAFLGQPGAGKTHLLSALANNLIMKRGQRLLYFPYIEGFNNLKDDFEALNSKLEEMQRVDVLFIDDLFKGKETGWEVKQMMGVINYRYLNNKPLMISSEHDIDKLCDLDEALGTRIYEMANDYTVTIKGDRWKLNHRLMD